MEEKKRLDKLRSYQILDTPPAQEIDRITKLASELFQTPIAAVSLVDETRQWFKSIIGLSVTETDRSLSFCSIAIQNPSEVMVVENAKSDARFKNNLLVTGDPNIGFYAGAPLVNADGIPLGSLCVIDTKPRQFSEQDQKYLKLLSFIVIDQIENHLLNLKLNAKEEEKTLILNNIPSLLYFKDIEDRFIHANRAGLKALGKSLDEVVGKTGKELFPEYGEDYNKEDQTVVRTKTAKFGVIEKLKNLDNTDSTISTDIVPILDENEEVNSILIVANDITQQKFLEKELFQRDKLKTVILDNTNLCLISCDLNGKIILFNKGAESLLGYKSEELINKVSPAILHDWNEVKERAQVLSKELNKNIEPGFRVFVEKAELGVPDENEWTYIKKNGEKIPVSLSVVAIRDEENHIYSYLGIAKDLSAQKKEKSNRESLVDLESKIEELNTATRRKSEFLATMSHEIRTPLTGIISLATIMVESIESREEKEDISFILNAALQLKDLIGSILDFAKIESGNFSLIERSASIPNLVNEVLKQAAYLAGQKDQNLKSTISKDIPESIVIDPSRVRQILTNLLSNASKFCDRGKTISFEASKVGNELSFVIEDQGPGIPENMRDEIFRPYIQIDGSYTRKEGGIGLGLPISSAIAKLMGGEVNILSTGNNGSRFELKIPIQDSTSKKQSSSIPLVSLKDKRILFAEDNDVNRFAISRLLAMLGTQTDEVTDGIQVLEMLKTKEYDLILLDIHMPNMSGMQVLERLKNEKICNTPIAMLSACAMQEEIDAAKNLGAKMFLTKPIEKNQLENSLKELLKKESD